MIKRLSVITMVVVMLLFASMYAEQAEPSEQNVVMEIKGMSCNL
jgi:hypothetical protein